MLAGLRCQCRAMQCSAGPKHRGTQCGVILWLSGVWQCDSLYAVSACVVLGFCEGGGGSGMCVRGWLRSGGDCWYFWWLGGWREGRGEGEGIAGFEAQRGLSGLQARMQYRDVGGLQAQATLPPSAHTNNNPQTCTECTSNGFIELEGHALKAVGDY